MLKKIGNKLLMALFAIIPIVLLDVVIGAMEETLMPEFGRKNLELALRQAEGYHDTLNVTVHPYLTYENTRNYVKNGMKVHNNWGLRDTVDVSEVKPNGVFRILTLGGSTTYGQGVNAPYNAWPKLLENKLNSKENNIQYQVLNGGLPYGTSAELLSHYLYRYRRFSPDLVIVHLGGNDAGPLRFEGYSDEYTHWRSLKSSGSNAIRPGEKFLINHSNIIKLIYSIWYDKMNYSKEGVFCHTNGVAREDAEKVKANVDVNEPTGYKSNLELLLRNVQMDSVRVMFFNFYGPNSSFLENGKPDAIKTANYVANLSNLVESNVKGRKKTRKAAFEVCEKLSIPFVEIEQGGINDTCFVDQCHLDKGGQTTKSEFVFGKLKESKLLD